MEPYVHIHGPGPGEGSPSRGHEETHFVQKRETFAKKEPPEAMNKTLGFKKNQHSHAPAAREDGPHIAGTDIYIYIYIYSLSSRLFANGLLEYYSPSHEILDPKRQMHKKLMG